MVQFPKNSKEEAKSEKMKTFTGHVMVIGERYKCASGDVVRVVIEVDDPREGRNRELTVMGFEEAIDFLQALKPDGHYRWYNLRQPIANPDDVCFFSKASAAREVVDPTCVHCNEGKENIKQ